MKRQRKMGRLMYRSYWKLVAMPQPVSRVTAALTGLPDQHRPSVQGPTCCPMWPVLSTQDLEGSGWSSYRQRSSSGPADEEKPGPQLCKPTPGTSKRLYNPEGEKPPNHPAKSAPPSHQSAGMLRYQRLRNVLILPWLRGSAQHCGCHSALCALPPASHRGHCHSWLQWHACN